MSNRLPITVGAAPAIINPSRVDGPGEQYSREEDCQDLQQRTPDLHLVITVNHCPITQYTHTIFYYLYLPSLPLRGLFIFSVLGESRYFLVSSLLLFIVYQVKSMNSLNIHFSIFLSHSGLLLSVSFSVRH